ncbi:UDP-Glycosyltransferase/glycogen phosphorylase [Coniochaeta hoffmannii]|uniref:UDP-Glycosyltransferase/glycogen phosphorylase n=1 Tax=Coniochaeta hoffmannii TaxID=91930 RepID=A0AA38RW83_9PEZI|nr:UDP-Glycosyltransferase/glycogen phosphorylase [Coniochaeta hoffmannii]
MATLATHTAITPSDDEAKSPIHLDTTTNEQGQKATVARDEQDHVAYPTYVPPTTEDLDGLSPRTRGQPDSEKLPPKTSLPKSQSDPLQNGGNGGAQSQIPKAKAKQTKSRPSTVSKYATELPRGSGERRMSPFPAVIKRAGTNISHLGGVRTSRRPQTQHEDDSTSSDDSSSSSSDEDEEDHHAKEHYRRFKVGNNHYHTRGKVSKRDGRLNISLKDTSNTGYLAKALGMAVKKVVTSGDGEDVKGTPGARHENMPNVVSRLSSASTTAGKDTLSCPRLNIVVMVIGSRGDVQPFLKIGKVLKEQYGHRVRIATHPAFRDFVEKDSGLEFFSVGGDPSELMAFMVKNPGMIPTLETVKAGDIGRRRAAMAEMFEGFWRACTRATDDEKDTQNLKMMGEKEPFVADAIIANPPSFAHIHCAEALGIPLHLMFTFPYTPTEAFPHPLASIKKSNVDPGYTNFISYPLVEMMVWQGLGDLVNDFRMKTLGLDPVSTLWAPGATYRLHVPFTYLWSPGLVPKPADWGPEIDVSGFVFLDLASSFKPPEKLTKFLESGEMPIYIGFGSIVVDDPTKFTKMIFEAVKLAGVRALVSKGWGGIGGDELDVPENIHLLDNVPHDWLFPRVRACVIHGGAGTTAIALRCGKPTMIVPFFGDQNFWGSMVGNAKAGPEPVPYKNLTAEKLAEGIKYCLTEEAQKAVGEIAKSIELEGDGAENACKAFHHHLTLSGQNSMRCSILENKIAVWKLKDTNLRLSAMAADILVEKGYLSWKKLRLLRHNEWNDFEGPGEPVTGIAGSVGRSIGNVFGGIGGIPFRIGKSQKKRKEKREMRKKRHQEKKERHAKHKAEKRAQKLEHAAANGELNGSAHEASKSTDLPAQSTEAQDYATKSQNSISPNGPEHSEHRDAGRHGSADADPYQHAPRSRMHRSDTVDTVATASTVESEHPAEEAIHHIGSGAIKSARALARAPVDLSMAVAQGFHNAPRLYGDDTVRRPPRVTGIRSGLRAAGHEFVYGIYDGWTGVVRLPYRGAKQNGVKGFAKGVGMGLTGFVLKDISAVASPIGYTLKGVAKQITRGEQPVRQVRRARIIQGQREVRALGEEERKDIAREVGRGWEVMRALWEALEKEEKHGLLLKRIHTRKIRGLGAPFESVRIAEQVLAALKRGEDIETVIGKQARVSDDFGRDGKSKTARDEHTEAHPIGRRSMGDVKKEVAIEEPPKPVAELKKEAQKHTQPEAPVQTPAEEKDNPFSASFKTIEENKKESQMEQERLTQVAA